ncbi:MAG: cobalamin-dependent protein, partial [Myxococcota bacterium]
MTEAETSFTSQAQRPIRVVTAASLFDGHDAAINIMRRILQSLGAEVIHLGHDRGVEEVVEAVLEEGADAVAISSYQGGHLEYFEYLVRRLAEKGLSHVRVYGGGGGTITQDEIQKLHDFGVSRIFSPEDGRKMGLEGMLSLIIEECLEAQRSAERDPAEGLEKTIESLDPSRPGDVSRLISFFEDHAEDHKQAADRLRTALAERAGGLAPVVGFTGTGGAGKSSVVDELVMRIRRDAPELRIALLLVDPTRRRSGGALLGDRIRMNAIGGDQVFVRSMATRRANLSLAAAVRDGLGVLRSAGFDLVLLESAGIGQSDSEIVDLVDFSLYVMTPDYG